MFTQSAEYYDALYAFKDYRAAAAAVKALVDERRPGAATLLDVGCGTGRHLETLRKHFEVEGLDLSEELLAVARKRCPSVPFHHADMRTFDLGRRFDVVTCLFSAIAYVRTLNGMREAVATMADHLNPGGLLLVEPWFTPETYWVNHLTSNQVDLPDLKISWMYVSAIRDRLSIFDIHYQVGTPEGISQFREMHEMGLFTHDEYLAAFADVGLEAEHDDEGFFGRGLYLGRKPQTSAA